MNKQFFFLDIDGTLLDQKYQSNTHLLQPLITELQEKGVIFSLNSNRAIEDLKPVSSVFDIEGPLIGENGAFAYIDGKNMVFLTSEQEERAREGKKKIQDEIIHYFRELRSKSIYWEDVDTVSSLVHPKKYDYPDGTLLVLNNKYRKFTISAHVKYIKDSKIYDAKDEVTDLAKYLKTLQIPGLKVSYSPLFWNLLVTAENVSKRTAIDILKERYYKSYTFFAIGDEYSDYLMIKDIGSFLTIKNAPFNVQDVADFTSKDAYTKGVYDIIKSTIDRL